MIEPGSATGHVGSAPEGNGFGLAQRLRAESHRAVKGRGDCYAFAHDYHARLRAAGVTARIVVVRSTMLNLYDSHSFVEVRKDGRWVIQDPTFDGGWKLNGRYVGTAEIQNALAKGTWGAVRFVGPQAAIRDYYVDPRLLMRYAHYETQRPDETWIKSTRVVRRLYALYYAQKKRPAGSVAGLFVVSGGSNWTVGSYTLEQLPDARWISPIMELRDGVSPVGDGEGAVSVLWVPRYR